MVHVNLKDARTQFYFLLAFKDATLRGAYKNKSELNALRADVMNSIQDHMAGDLSGGVEALISKVYEDNREYSDFSYGNAQKAVNMFFKYLYCGTMFNAGLEEEFADCHCPVDSIIIDKLIEQILSGSKPRLSQAYEAQKILKIALYRDQENGRPLVNALKRKYFRGVVWSGMKEEQYAAMQSLLRAWAADEGCTQLELDFKYWASSTEEEEERE